MKCKKYKWCAAYESGRWYAVSRINGKRVRMHRFIVDLVDKNLVVDHIDHNGLNNMRENLRIVTNQINCQNRRYSFISQRTIQQIIEEDFSY